MIPTLGVQSSLPKQPNSRITLTVPGSAWLPDPFQGSSRSDQRAALPARPCHPFVWSGACGAVPIHVSARARQRPQHSPASAGSAPQRPLLLSPLPAGAGTGVRVSLLPAGAGTGVRVSLLPAGAGTGVRVSPLPAEAGTGVRHKIVHIAAAVANPSPLSQRKRGGSEGAQEQATPPLSRSS